MDLFAQATRQKLRFATSIGELTTEQLWQLSLLALDTIAKAVNKELKESTEESFIKKASSGSATLQFKMDVLLYIIKDKLEEEEQKKLAKVKAERKKHLLELINSKENEELSSKSLDELRKELNAL